MKKLDQIFDISSIDQQSIKEYPLSSITSSKINDQEDDYQLARTTMRKLLIKGEATLDDIIDLARNSEHPRSFEVTGQLIKTMSEVAKDLIGLQKQVKDLQDKPEEKQAIGTQNNIMFAGSTTDLLKMLKNDNSKTIDN
ncbi:MAG: terminase [Alphaproteobacteria bacterium]|nr:terminase [Alphaproteobacteria bacterium]